MVAELEKILYDDGGGFRATYINDISGLWHFHPEYELVLNIKSNGTRIVGDSVELFDQYDMVLIAGNIPHCWNYYRQNNTLPDNHGIIVNFKLESIGEALLSQHELHCLKELLSEADRGIVFSVEDSRKANCRSINSSRLAVIVIKSNLSFFRALLIFSTDISVFHPLSK